MSHKWLKDAQQGALVKGIYLVKQKTLSITRKGEPYLVLTLADRTGEKEARIWENAKEVSGLFQKGELVEVEGEVVSFKDQTQIKIQKIKRFEGPVDPSLYLETSPQSPSSMITSLVELLKKIEDPHLSALINRFLSDEEFIEKFKEAPAAKNFHHNYIGGLLEHTLGVCRLTEAVVGLYPQLHKDLLLTGAFLHDIGKIKELSWDLVIDYTDEGRLLGHLTLGVIMLEQALLRFKSFPYDIALRLKHLILSHHGELEFGSPKRPKFLEAFALHFIDDLDAKMNGICRFMEKDPREDHWTDFNRMFERFFLKGRILETAHMHNGQAKDQDSQPTLFSL